MMYRRTTHYNIMVNDSADKTEILTRSQVTAGPKSWWRSSLIYALQAPGFMKWTVTTEEFDMVVEAEAATAVQDVICLRVRK